MNITFYNAGVFINLKKIQNEAIYILQILRYQLKGGLLKIIRANWKNKLY